MFLSHLHFPLYQYSTPIFTEDGEGGSGFAAAAAAASGGAGGYDFGVDPNLDPELALALRVSMEEERARQEAAAKKAAEDGSKQEKGPEQSSSSKDIPMTDASLSSTQEIDKGVEPMVSSWYLLLIHPYCQLLLLFSIRPLYKYNVCAYYELIVMCLLYPCCMSSIVTQTSFLFRIPYMLNKLF